MACLNIQNTYFREHLFMAAFIRFSEHIKVDAFFIKQILNIMHMKVIYINCSFWFIME